MARQSFSADAEFAADLLLDDKQRRDLWLSVLEKMESYIAGIRELPVSAEPTPEAVRSLVRQFDFSRPLPADDVVKMAADALSRTQVHTPHPRYFGLFNPTPTTVGIAADALVAVFNPQLAAWKHNPFAVEVERYLIRELGSKFGYAQADGVMASGGSEANHTALLVALNHAFPVLERDGLRGLSALPVFYVSSESHHSFHKAARLCGLGNQSLREIPVDENLTMELSALETAIEDDRRKGFVPFMVVGTAGTTNAGAIDPLDKIAVVAAREKLWFHADAAWGGAGVLVPEMRPLLAGIDRADSITLDAHKWLSAPMGAGIFLTRHPQILQKTFHISAAYVPPQAEGIEAADPYESSIHWSRRFIGLKVFLALAVAGWEGYGRVLRQMTEIGQELRHQLEVNHWHVVNPSPFPICCFQDQDSPSGPAVEYLEAVARDVIGSGKAWISTTRIRKNIPVLRACITSYRTSREDLAILVAALNEARAKLKKKETAKSATPEV